MGFNTTKVEFDCDCGSNYGYCDEKAMFIMKYSRSCDLGTIYYKHGKDKIKYLGTFTDLGLDSLLSLLNGDSEIMSNEEFKIIEKNIIS